MRWPGQSHRQHHHDRGQFGRPQHGQFGRPGCGQFGRPHPDHIARPLTPALIGAKFPIATAKDLEGIGLESTRKAFAKHFTGTKLHQALDACKSDQGRNKLYEYRAVAAHRLVLSRNYIMGPIVDGIARIEPSNVVQVLIDGAPKATGGPPVRVPLDESFTESHLRCVTRWTTELLGAAAELAERRLPSVTQRVPPAPVTA